MQKLVLTKGLIGKAQAEKIAKQGKPGDRVYYRYTNKEMRCAYHCGFEMVGGGHVLTNMGSADLSIRDAFAKADRNEAIIVYRAEHPDISLEEIGKIFKVSRQRVFAIIKRAKGLCAPEKK